MSKLTEKECKSILFKLGIKYGVSPNLISTRLLSPEDKVDMMNGDVPLESLDLHVKLWKEGGCEDMVGNK
jgi:hypothetical protein